MATTDDYYRVLEVDRTADRPEIQRAYRRLARRFHPDVNREPGAAEHFRLITEAYEVLSDGHARARYDRQGDAWRSPPVEYDTGYARSGVGDLFGDLFDDVFDGLLSGGFGVRAGRGRPGADLAAEIEVSVEEACRGAVRRLARSTATGTLAFEVAVPPGVTDGQRIRLPGRGAAGFRGGPRGDLYLVVRLAPHPRYRVDDHDIIVDLPVAPWEAVLGAEVPLDAPGGPLRVQVPAGSSSGRRLRFPGRGLPGLRGPAGDLYAEIRIVVPDRLPDRQRELWRRLAEESGFDPRDRWAGGRAA